MVEESHTVYDSNAMDTDENKDKELANLCPDFYGHLTMLGSAMNTVTRPDPANQTLPTLSHSIILTVFTQASYEKEQTITLCRSYVVLYSPLKENPVFQKLVSPHILCWFCSHV
jgi:hypothetical protein